MRAREGRERGEEGMREGEQKMGRLRGRREGEGIYRGKRGRGDKHKGG